MLANSGNLVGQGLEIEQMQDRREKEAKIAVTGIEDSSV